MVSAGMNELDIDQPCFDNPNEEALYWKQIAEEYVQKLQDVRDEFEEFQEGSRELEQELEAQLEQYESRVKDLTSLKCALEEENELLKEKLQSITTETYVQITTLQDDNNKLNTIKSEMEKYIRELEQSNDDLERAKRATICSLEDFDARLNHAIERNAFLENELEEKEELIITVQRLKDEARDLKADLALTNKQRHQSLTESKSKISETELSMAEASVDGKPTESLPTLIRQNSIETEKKNKTNSVISRATNTSGTPGTPSLNRPNSNILTPSARISALNIVSDLLRKVGALESKLASCRNFVQDHPRPGKPPHVNAITPIIDSPGNKTLNSSSKAGNSNNLSGLVKVNV